MNLFNHIEANPKVLGGKPCIKGTRISVELIMEFIASGATVADITMAYAHLSKEEVQDAILYASQFNNNDILIEIKQ